MICFSHIIVQLILKTKNKFYLFLGVGINLLNLIFFKYILTYLQHLTKESAISIPFIQSLSELALPLAISFYTFQMIAYIVDAWRGKFIESPFINFLLFILFFPQLIAGPIMRHDDFFDQIGKAKLNWDYISKGILHILSGIVKKVLIADQIAKAINPLFADPGSFDGLSILMSAFAFSLQVYGDFSGYTDLARGSAFLLGYEIPENFHSPFLSVSFSEFWSRWHITLSTWIRDYLYIPLGGNRVTEGRFMFNTITVMSLAGLWHGNTYTFFIWGFLHGVLLAIERFSFGKIDRKALSLIQKIFGFIYVFIGFNLLSPFFRLDSLDKIFIYWSAISNTKGLFIYKPDLWALLFACLFLNFIEFKDYFQSKLKKYDKILVPGLALIVFFALVKIENPVETFIYFQF
ncbi:MAG: MBOAT family protein [Leptospira sp.]|nr:MBOAT family protein [Leptospira sp.]